MAKIIKPLTDTEVKRAKPTEKEYNLPDGQGLFLRVKPNGSKLWIMNYYRPITKQRNNIGLLRNGTRFIEYPFNPNQPEPKQ